jgi:ribonuclease R
MSAAGYGFVQTAEGEFFIPASGIRGAFDGDLVEVALLSGSRTGSGSGSGGRSGGGNSIGRSRSGRTNNHHTGSEGQPAARIVRVIDRAHDTVVGRYEVADVFGVVVPSDPRIPYDIFTMREEAPHVPDGALVRVRIAQFPTRHSAATGFVEEVLAETTEAPRAGIDMIIGRHKLETMFSEGALEEAAAARVNENEALAEGYVDIRDRLVFTIDPADARDFDDALSLEYVEPTPEAPAGLWRIGVHIADVSAYVPWNSSLDLDARRRATSVYLADRVIPMLPHELSNDMCSLKPGVTRRAFTLDIWVNEGGEVKRTHAYPSLIQSKTRLTYDEVLEVLEAPSEHESGAGAAGGAQAPSAATEASEPPEAPTPTPHLPQACKEAYATAREALQDPALQARLRWLAHFAEARDEARRRAGGIDFDSVEARVVLNAEGVPTGIKVRTKNAATRLVEECMIMANEAVAETLAAADFPCMYRVHEAPAPDALGELVPVFQEFTWFTHPLEWKLLAGDPHAIQQIIDATKGRSEGELVNSLLLRAMKRAVYSPQNEGHYGLASEAYCHFTSPIRRYPDLVVHRMLKAYLFGRPEKFYQEVTALPWMAEHASTMERVADEAARQSQELKMVEYLQDFVGQSFSGVVSGVASYGLYVRLECTAEGIVPVRALGAEYFFYDPVQHTLSGTDTGKMYRLGQRIAVVLKVADPATTTLEFSLAGE